MSTRGARSTAVTAFAVAVLAALVACGGDGDEASSPSAAVIDPGDGGDYEPGIRAEDFVDGIDHPYLPLQPGARWVYVGTSDGESERIVVVVTPERTEVYGVSATVVRDTVWIGGEMVEDTYDWFAQDEDGNVWYLGEASQDFEDGKPAGTEGSWEAGVDGALPGIVMPADPAVGDAYRQEFHPGEAEDLGEVVRLDETVEVDGRTYSDVLVTKEWNPLEPDAVEEKSYAPGVGMVMEEQVAGGDSLAVLIEHDPGS